MTDIMKLRKLLARVESATGPDREIDCALAEWFGLVNEAHCKMWCARDGRTDITREMFVRAWSKYYTESIDAAVALCESVLPGCSLLMAKNPDKGLATVHTMPIGISGNWYDCGKQATLPLAICAAVLKAKIVMLEKAVA